MLIQQPNGKTAWVGNGSRNVSEAEEEAAAMANDDEEQQELEQQSQTFFPLQQRRRRQYPGGRSSGVESLGYCKLTL
jgi:AICAR transformylase/IMP cyclohydrolase PurH